MSVKVLKPFKTTQRRFAEGDAVSILDDLSPFTFEDLKDGGFVGVETSPGEPTEAKPRRK